MTVKISRKPWGTALIFLGVAVLAVGVGILVHRLTRRPAVFARIAEADRVVVYRFDKPQLSITYTGAQLSQIVEAIQNSRRDRGAYDTPVGTHLMDFYKAEAKIATVYGGGLFMAGGKQYRDPTDTLSALVGRDLDKRYSRMMTKQQAERKVAELKARVKDPLEEETRRRIAELTNDLSKEHGFREVDGKKIRLITAATRELRKIGAPALPQLIDVAQADSAVMMRQCALDVVYKICLDEGRDPMEFLPVFVLSMSDGEDGVRASAVGYVGKMALEFSRPERHEELSQLIPYLVKALSDESQKVQNFAGKSLFRLGREDLLPKALLDKYKDPRSGYMP